MTLRIEAPTFCAGVMLTTRAPHRVAITAPILKFTLGWTKDRLVAYCEQKHWKVEAVVP